MSARETILRQRAEHHRAAAQLVIVGFCVLVLVSLRYTRDSLVMAVAGVGLALLVMWARRIVRKKISCPSCGHDVACLPIPATTRHPGRIQEIHYCPFCQADLTMMGAEPLADAPYESVATDSATLRARETINLQLAAGAESHRRRQRQKLPIYLVAVGLLWWLPSTSSSRALPFVAPLLIFVLAYSAVRQLRPNDGEAHCPACAGPVGFLPAQGGDLRQGLADDVRCCPYCREDFR